MKHLHKVWEGLSGAEVTTKSVVYRENFVVVRIREEGRDLEEGSMGRNEGRGNPEEPDLGVRSNGSEQLRGRGGATGRKQYSTRWW